MAGRNGMTDEQRDAWAARRFYREVATEEKRRFLREIGHEPVHITTGEEWVQLGLSVDVEEEPELHETDWALVHESELPKQARSFVKALLRSGYAVNAYHRYGARRNSATGRLLKPPQGEFVLVAALRGDERLTASWKWTGKKWESDEAFDYTNEGGITPSKKGITQLRKDRL